MPEGRIIVSQIDKHIVGYIILLHPDPLERWSDGNHEFIMELGAIEVAHQHRSLGLAGKMLELSVRDNFVENYIIITTEYYWHWDLKNSGLDVYEYKNLMIRLMQRAGFEVFQTNDPEITGHPANTLMARIGKNITDKEMQQFDEIRFKTDFNLIRDAMTDVSRKNCNFTHGNAHVNDTIHDAMNMMSRLSIRHIPIVGDDGNLAGIISDKTLISPMPSLRQRCWLSLDLEAIK